jgi:3-deoxy-D-manno-octulosonic-acid transferase
VYNNFKLILAPHHISERHLIKTDKQFPKYVLRYSEKDKVTPEEWCHRRILILDNIGMLSSVYAYGDICYIGGGFGKGIHNTLEAAVYGKPLIFGPKYKKFTEAVDLIEAGAAFIINGSDDLLQRIDFMNDFRLIYDSASSASADYVLQHRGGTDIIMKTLRNYL